MVHPETIPVSASDEDGVFVLGSHALSVDNVAPSVSLGGGANINEGDTFTLAITGSDPAGAADPLFYNIDWDDGSAIQTLSAAQLAALGGSVSHVFADDEDGPVNATLRTITVSADDGDGGVDTATHGVTVHNVAPSLAVTGAATATTGLAYTLNLANYVDPGQDTLCLFLRVRPRCAGDSRTATPVAQVIFH